MPFGFHLTVDTLPSLAMSARASGALPPPSDMAPSIRAPVGLQPTGTRRCPAHTTGLSDCPGPFIVGVCP